VNRLGAVLLCLLLAACASQAAPRGEAIKAVDAVPEPDRSCQVDADCEVRNVGNCCGHYPACVNRDSPTFPERVREACEREGRMAICGFPDIAGCRCVEQRCENVLAPDAESR